MPTGGDHRRSLRAGLLVVIVFAFVFIMVLLFKFELIELTNHRWDVLTSNFSAQANSLGEALPPGGTGTIRIPPCDADELILLPRYCPAERIAVRLANRSPVLIDDLLRYSNNKSIAPALVWLKKDRIRSINRCELVVGVDLTVTPWKLNGSRDIKVIKEASSLNGFLSISFPED
jgi:hypothetical protein